MMKAIFFYKRVFEIDFNCSFEFYGVFIGNSFAFKSFEWFNCYLKGIMFWEKLINFDKDWVNGLCFWFKFIFVGVINL